MAELHAWPLSGPVTETAPKPIQRPCDYGLLSAWYQLETQLGTVEAYNRLAAFAARRLAEIESGHIEPQNPIYAVSIKG